MVVVLLLPALIVSGNFYVIFLLLLYVDVVPIDIILRSIICMYVNLFCFGETNVCVLL